MDDFVSESDSDYTSYWRDWVSARFSFSALSTGWIVETSAPSCHA